TRAGTSISTYPSEHCDRVDGAPRHALEADRCQHELELPPAEPGARVGEILQLTVVDEPQAHGDDPDHVDRHAHASVSRRGRVLGDVRGEHGDLALVEPGEAGGLEPRPWLVGVVGPLLS